MYVHKKKLSNKAELLGAVSDKMTRLITRNENVDLDQSTLAIVKRLDFKGSAWFYRWFFYVFMYHREYETVHCFFLNECFFWWMLQCNWNSSFFKAYISHSAAIWTRPARPAPDTPLWPWGRTRPAPVYNPEGPTRLNPFFDPGGRVQPDSTPFNPN